jgi:putative SOS response-associated peptidase YedK
MHFVPMSSFCEYAQTKPRKTPKWFAIDDGRPLVAFAGTSVKPTPAAPQDRQCGPVSLAYLPINFRHQHEPASPAFVSAAACSPASINSARDL